MKRSTTNHFRARISRAALVTIAAVFMSSGLVSVGNHVFADSFEAQIAQLQNQIGAYQNEAARLHAEADTLQRALGVLTLEKNQIQAQVDLSQAKLEKLNADIDANEKKLEKQKRVYSERVADLSADTKVSPIELLAGSQSIGDYIRGDAYQSSIQQQIKSAIKSVKELKAQLAKQKTDVEHVLADQKSQRDSLAAKEAEQAALVAATQGQEAAYQNMIGQSNGQIASLRAQQRAANAALGGKAIAGDPNMGGYPNNLRGPKDSMVDPWGMYNRECVSYTAWKVYQSKGYMPYWGGRGNANEWPSSAQSDGIATGSTPRVGSVAISMSGYYGHAMWVEAVNGNQIYVSQMNYDMAGSYSEMWLNGSGLIYIYF